MNSYINSIEAKDTNKNNALLYEDKTCITSIISFFIIILLNVFNKHIKINEINKIIVFVIKNIKTNVLYQL